MIDQSLANSIQHYVNRARMTGGPESPEAIEWLRDHGFDPRGKPLPQSGGAAVEVGAPAQSSPDSARNDAPQDESSAPDTNDPDWA